MRRQRHTAPPGASLARRRALERAGAGFLMNADLQMYIHIRIRILPNIYNIYIYMQLYIYINIYILIHTYIFSYKHIYIHIYIYIQHIYYTHSVAILAQVI